MAFDPTLWTKANRDKLIQEFVDSGKSLEVATLMVDSALNAAGELTDEEANPGGHWKRQQAGGDAVGTDRDPSPDSYKAAQEPGEA